MGWQLESIEAKPPCTYDFRWTDGKTGRTRKLNKQDMAEMQTILAECIGMERGISSDRKMNMVEAEKAVQIGKECRQMEDKRNIDFL